MIRDLPPRPTSWDPAAHPTAEQLVDWLGTLDREDRVRVVEVLQEQSEIGYSCWLQDHPGQLREAWRQVRHWRDEAFRS